MKDMLDTVICGNVFDKLPEIPTGKANCCVTSPPYWGLRDYGVEGQLGLEKTPEEYVAKMVEVFREVKRVLRDDGTLWLNLGDSYAHDTKGDTRTKEDYIRQGATVGALLSGAQNAGGKRKCHHGLKPKDLCGIPWRVAFALQADGWYLRQDIIWHKPNPMPESVRDRCTKAHEYIFLMTKRPKYYCDMEAIKVPLAESTSNDRRTLDEDYTVGRPERGFVGNPSQGSGMLKSHGGTANKRSVWTVTTKPYSEAHFATFPPDLILPCILAGCPQWVCKKCGEPRVRIVDKELVPTKKGVKTTVVDARDLAADKNDQGSNRQKDGHKPGWINQTTTTGWTDCGCNAGFDGGVVMDPFMGSGTVGLVAYQNNRHYMGIELNPEYCKLGRIEKERDKYALFND